MSVPPLDLKTNTATLTAWVKGRQTVDHTGIIMCRDGPMAAGLSVVEGRLRYVWGGLHSDWDSELTVPRDRWAFVAVVVEPHKATLYVDAKSAVHSLPSTSRVRGLAAARPPDGAATHEIEEFRSPTIIGADTLHQGEMQRCWQGLIDDVRIYDRALSTDVVNRLYTSGSAANPPSISPDAVEFGGHRYRLYPQRMAWREASAYCAKLGGHLVTITSKEENDFVAALARAAGSEAWIGLSTARPESNWEWVTREEQVFTDWARGEPSGQHHERYGSLSEWQHHAYQWDDRRDESLPFMCEWESAGPCPPAILGGPADHAFAGKSYSYSVTATGRPEPEIDVTDLPEWLQFHDKRTVSGTPPGEVAGRRFAFRVSATNDQGRDEREVSLFIVAEGEVEPAPQGVILREWWTGIAGHRVIDLTSQPSYPDNPKGQDYLTVFETTERGNDYGQRFRGLVYPPVSGDYTFTFRSDDGGRFFLGTHELPRSKRLLMASHVNRVTSRPVSLVAGLRYYVEVLHKQAGGGDIVRVGWTRPDGIVEDRLPGEYLSPWCPGPRAPTIVDVGPGAAIAGMECRFSVAVAGSPSPTIIVEGLPGWLKFDGKRAISGTPPETVVGTKVEGIIIAKNTEGEDRQSFTLVVEALDLTRGLVGWWGFDEGEGTVARDSSGKGNDGRLVGNPRRTTGHAGGALEFDGAGGHVAAAVSRDITGASPRSVSAWIRTFDQEAPVVSWGANRTGEKYVFRVQDADGVAGAMRIEVKGGWVVGNTVVADGRWHHVAVVYPPGSTDVLHHILYVDGKLEPMSSTDGQQMDTADGGRIVIAADEEERCFSGTIDDVRIYDRALSGEEIAALHREPERIAARLPEGRAPERLGALLQAFDLMLVEGDLDEARRGMETEAGKAENAAMADALRAAARVAEQLEAREKSIRRAAEGLVGAKMKIMTAKEELDGRLVGVTDSGLSLTVKVTRGGGEAEMPKSVAWSDLSSAQEDFFASEWRPKGADGHVARGIVLLLQGRRAAADKAFAAAGDHALADYASIHDARVRAAASEEAAMAAMDRARGCIAARDWKGAIKALEEALAAKPDDEEAAKLLARARYYVFPKTLTLDCGDGVTMEFVYISPGSFTMGGNTATEYTWAGVESPPHPVTITRGFYMGKYLVTQPQYEAVVGMDPSYRTSLRGRMKPVDSVSWPEAVECCRLIGERTGCTVRLPTEAEWEYACRAGSSTQFCYGDDPSGLGDYAWFKENSRRRHDDVGQKNPNAWGLYDMHGLLFEWCSDWYSADYYAESPSHDPPGPPTGTERVMRGGWSSGDALACRSALRSKRGPTSENNINGFRVVVEVSVGARVPRGPRHTGGR
ncbi:MAG: SUMF1/EgtB/PvdO family nonheme iron enzyme [Planctomycetota bacterium]